ncbi:hypothetical protein [Mycobacterium riyadhense]|uniref:hypothetical protein n=1 Tax=Mycobacterium riyadhense TaxID=486698 RepID=UPI001958356B|nr:hypothetical protein [Mycobacterium riyadhense]
MPQVDSGGAGFRVPGAYEVLLRQQCASSVEPDPRLLLGTDEQRAEHERLAAEAAVAGEELFAERLAAGEPIVVERRRFGGRSVPRQDGWPAWLGGPYSDVQSVRVFADDTVQPMYDEVS